jgi:hypothetical protein
MVLAGIKVPDTVRVRDAIDLSQSASEPFLFNHAMRSWLFGVMLSESAERAPDAELLAVATILHDPGLTERYTAEDRFEVDGANAARSFLKGRGTRRSRFKLFGMPSHFIPHDLSLFTKSPKWLCPIRE